MTGTNPGIFLKHGIDGGHAQGTSVSTFASSSSVASIFDEEYVFRDKATGRPLANVCYRLIKSNGEMVKGVTDQSGRTQRVKTNAAETIIVEIEEAE